MLQFVRRQQADAPVQSVYDPAGVLLLSLRGIGKVTQVTHGTNPPV